MSSTEAWLLVYASFATASSLVLLVAWLNARANLRANRRANLGKYWQ